MGQLGWAVGPRCRCEVLCRCAGHRQSSGFKEDDSHGAGFSQPVTGLPCSTLRVSREEGFFLNRPTSPVGISGLLACSADFELANPAIV